MHSVPRLMKGQGCIVGAGALEYPAEFQGASEKTLIELGIGKTITLTSTYDHRVIQGAGSGEFLKIVHELLIGQRNFYEDIFAALRIPYAPIHWASDINVDLAERVDKTARVQELINAFRVRGHLMADIDPLEYVQRTHPDLEIEKPRPDVLGPRPRVRHRRLRRQAPDEAPRHPRRAARLVLPHDRHRVHAHPGPGAAPAGSRRTSR